MNLFDSNLLFGVAAVLTALTGFARVATPYLLILINRRRPHDTDHDAREKNARQQKPELNRKRGSAKGSVATFGVGGKNPKKE
jgi:hypothetical protein